MSKIPSAFFTEGQPEHQYQSLVSSTSSASTNDITLNTLPSNIHRRHFDHVCASPKKKLKISTEDAVLVQESDQVKALVTSGRVALADCGGLSSLSRYLSERFDLILTGETYGKGGGAGVKDVIISNWIDELMHFLTIKTISGDTTMPSEMIPSAPIDEAWKGLMIMPAAYVKVCQSLGNEHVIDRDPDSDDEDVLDERRRKKRFNGTLRTYYQCFRQEPPRLFWPDPTIKRNRFKFFSSSTASATASALQQTMHQTIQQAADKMNTSKELIMSSGIKRMFDDCR